MIHPTSHARVGLIHRAGLIRGTEPLATLPVGSGLASLGYALWSERRGQAPQRVLAGEHAQLGPTPAA
jgi:hypothetical protein